MRKCCGDCLCHLPTSVCFAPANCVLIEVRAGARGDARVGVEELYGTESGAKLLHKASFVNLNYALHLPPDLRSTIF